MDRDFMQSIWEWYGTLPEPLQISLSVLSGLIVVTLVMWTISSAIRDKRDKRVGKFDDEDKEE